MFAKVTQNFQGAGLSNLLKSIRPVSPMAPQSTYSSIETLLKRGWN